MKIFEVLLLFIPLVLFFKYVKEVDIAFVAAFWNTFTFDSLKHRASLFSGVCALCVLAFSYMLGKFTEGSRKVFFIKEFKFKLTALA